jgi:hypothetical protein
LAGHLRSIWIFPNFRLGKPRDSTGFQYLRQESREFMNNGTISIVTWEKPLLALQR